MIATDSEAVVFGITERIKRWEVENWKTFDQSLRLRVDVKNQDLWKLLLHVIRTLQSKGVSVSFWRIPRKWNDRVDKLLVKLLRGRQFRSFISVDP